MLEKEGTRLWMVAAAAWSLSLVSVPPAGVQTTIIDNGRFPQCGTVSASDKEAYYRDSLLTVSLPEGTKFRFAPTLTDYYCLPDMTGPSRFFVQISARSGIGLPTGGLEDGLVEVDLPEGLSPTLLSRFGKRSSGDKDGETQEWLFFDLNPDQEITFRNSDDSLSITGKGPIALLTDANSVPDGIRQIDYIKPKPEAVIPQ